MWRADICAENQQEITLTCWRQKQLADSFGIVWIGIKKPEEKVVYAGKGEGEKGGEWAWGVFFQAVLAFGS